ncbi:hypothetical protein D3C78_1919540 [compost metagenome]
MGIEAITWVGLSMICPLIWNCAPQSRMVIPANTRMFTGRPQKLPTTMVRRHGEERAKSQKLRIKVP